MHGAESAKINIENDFDQSLFLPTHKKHRKLKMVYISRLDGNDGASRVIVS